MSGFFDFVDRLLFKEEQEDPTYDHEEDEKSEEESEEYDSQVGSSTESESDSSVYSEVNDNYSGDTTSQSEAEYACESEEPPKTYAWEEARPYQDNFRAAIFTRDNGCVVSNAHLDECQACHIKPAAYCSYDEKCDPNNGLTLCASLRMLFDKLKWSIDPATMTVVVTKEAVDKNYSILEYANKQLDISAEHLPYIVWHYAEFKKMNN